MRGRLHYILAILLMAALCGGPLSAGALELKLDESLPAPAVEAGHQPAGDAVSESSFKSIFSGQVLWVLAICLAIYLGWWFGIFKYVRKLVRRQLARIRAARLAAGQQHQKKPQHIVQNEPKLQAKPKPPIPNKPQPKPQVKPALRSSEPKRKPSPSLTRSHVTRTMSDLVMAKQLVTEEAYDQAEVCAMSALRSEPYNLDAYVVALKILSKYQTPQLIGLVRGALQLLRLKNPRLWHDVAKQGRQLAPEIENWEDEPAIKRNS